MTGWWPLLAVLACLAVAACAARSSGDDDKHPGGFYGGVSGGMSRP